MRRIALILLALLAFLPGVAPGAEADARETFRRANEAFARGAALLEENPAEAEAALDESIALFRDLIEEQGIVNAKLYYNVGNAYMLKGEIGEAILNYRRAERLDPLDANLAQNLAVARARVQTAVEPSPGGQVVETLLFWHDDLPMGARFWALAFFSGAAWILLGLRLLGRARGAGVWGAVVSFAIAGAMLASLLADERAVERASEAVVVADSVVARKGPDEEAYEPRFSAPLAEGVEVVIEQRRPGWAYVRLADGREAWVPSEAIEAV